MAHGFIPFALPDIGEEEISAVADTLRSLWVTTGPKTREFEQKFIQYLNTHYHGLSLDINKDSAVEAIAVNSATAGLHLALEACGVGVNDEVIVPTLTFTASAEVVRYLGAHPVFVDCAKDTLNIDIEQIESKINAKTKVIIAVHFAGLPCDMPKILHIARKHNLKVIEDAAHTLPSKINNVLIGNHASDAIVYSFYATKTITTGEGGMIVTRSKDIANRCKIMRLHGINRDAFDRYTSKKPSWYYEVVAPGFKYNLTDVASALGICQLAKVDKFHLRRTLLAQRYRQRLNHLPLKMPPDVVNHATDVHSWHLFVINLLGQDISRDDFIEKMSTNGIGTSVHFIPLHLQPYWKNQYKLQVDDFPVATAYYESAVSLPLYTRLSDEEQDYIIKTIINILS